MEYNALHNMTVAVSSLPNEILAIIFEIGHSSSTYASGFELLVSHVSQHWKDVASQTPKLWTTIRRMKYQRSLEPIELYLHRSKASAIDLRVEIGGGYGDDDIALFSNLFRIHLSRWHRLSILSDTLPKVIQLLACTSSVLTPILQSLWIECM